MATSTDTLNTADQNTTDKREITLTEKGEELYQSHETAHLKKLKKLWERIERTISDIEKQSTIDSLKIINDTLNSDYVKYTAASKDYVDFLQRSQTMDTRKESDNQFEIVKSHNMVVDAAMKQIFMKIQSLAMETKSASQKSNSHRSSRRSSTAGSRGSSAIARKRAELEGSKAKLKFVEEEAKIIRKQAMLEEQRDFSNAKVSREKADLQAELEVLAQKKEIEATKAELGVLEAEDEGQNSLDLSDYDVDQEVRAAEQTKKYVEEVSTQNDGFSTPVVKAFPEYIPTPRNLNIAEGNTNFQRHEQNNGIAETRSQRHFNVNAPEFRQTHNVNSMPYIRPTINESITSEFSRFLLKKDLLLTRLYKFSDKPEFYAMWKASFKGITEELSVTTDEELDLLLKWLGPESTRQAITIRSSSVNDPTKGLARIWERMDERYGSPELVESTLKAKLMNFPKITNKDHEKLYELADILSEIESAKQDEKYKTLLAYFDSSLGILPVVNKLPYGIQEKWTTHAARYKREHSVTFPPFGVFVEFIQNTSKIKNDPCFQYDTGHQERSTRTRTTPISTMKTDVSDKMCPFHKSASHTLNTCKAFKGKPISERRNFVKENGLCFRCCESSSHLKMNCTENVKCLDCGSDRHPSAMHITNYTPNNPNSAQGEETEQKSSQIEEEVNSKCTQICAGKPFSGKSCAKYVLVNVYTKDNPQRSVKAYAILDDQSNKSLAKSDLFERLNVHTESKEYTLSSCNGTVVTSGRRLTGCCVRSFDGQTILELPELTECNYIPDSREEIPTPEVAYHHDHLADISDCIPPLDDNAPILLLIGRDLISAHHVLEHRIGSSKAPYGQRLSLGWVIIGETCLGNIHPQEHVNVNKTYILRNNRPSVFTPCSSEFEIKEDLTKQDIISNILNNEKECETLFSRTENDDKPGLSVEDRQFLQIMEKEFQKDSQGNWFSPLPFRPTRQRLPNNREQAMKRARSLHMNLQKDKKKSEHFIDFMKNLLDNGNAEVAPSVSETEECWYLPIFGVYHPRKPDKIRVVLDSSAKHNGICLNDVLLSGPDLTNNLLGILLRFRKERVAITADIEQMFYCFKVCEKHRNFLRFLWYRSNDPKQEMIEYRMCVHVFGNKPSPAVATYGLIKTAMLNSGKFGQDVSEFVENNFYVDDGLVSLPSDAQAIDLLKRTQQALRQEGNLRLHKITSNSKAVMQAFPSEDLAKDVKNLSPETDIPLQRSLGICWDIESDAFTYQLSSGDKPYTRRGLLSTINSLYDPIGFAAPVTLQGKLFLRNLLKGTIQWDDPLPAENQEHWDAWKNSLQLLSQIQIPRPYTSSSLKSSVSRELHLFADASEQAIAGVAYLKTIFNDKPPELSFVLGKAKVAPLSGHTMPRLELCAAVLTTELYQTLSEHMDIEVDEVKFYTDSKIVLGYIHNETRRFYTYVSNRVERIRRISKPEQWTYISTELNPADYATRIAPVSQLQDSPWLKGPLHILTKDVKVVKEDFPLEKEDSDKELRPIVTSLKTTFTNNSLLESKRFETFSSLKGLVNTIAYLRHIAISFKIGKSCQGWHKCSKYKTPEAYEQSEKLIFRLVQQEVYSKEIECIEQKISIPKDSPIRSLNPYVDDIGILRVGGRLDRSDVSINEKNPIIIPGRNYIATLLVLQYHQSVAHQGRHFTEGAIRKAGFWVTGGKRLIAKVISECVKCRKSRGSLQTQQMADLPCNRLHPAPPFTYVGIDTFGPYTVVARRTRGGLAHGKRWAILFTCLTIRAIHIEVVEEMSSSAFINALRRLIAIRGNIKEIRSDKGTNFVGATGDLGIHTINVEDRPVKDFLYNKGTTWIFNPPHSSHFGGVWERMIGIARRILDSMLSETGTKHLTSDVLSTLMAEVSAIVNNRPIVSVSNSSDQPEVLSPSTLLTRKNDNSVDAFTHLDIKDMYKAQWKFAQRLAETFWNRWRIEYLQTLQTRRKWQCESPNLSEGDVVLLRDKSVCRNEWPIGVIDKTFPSQDGKVRKLEIRIRKDGRNCKYLRPISEVVLLHSSDGKDKQVKS